MMKIWNSSYLVDFESWIDLDDRRLELSVLFEEKCRTERGIYAPDWAVVGLRQQVPPAILRCLVCVIDLLLLTLNLSKLVSIVVFILVGDV